MTRLTPADIEAAAKDLGCDVAAVRAVIDVESAGKGFDPETGKPIILYEPHVFSRRTGRRFDASHPTLSYRAWRTLPYPKGQAARWAQLLEATALDRRAALESASWGLFQIMGFNYAHCGFADVEEFVTAMHESEGRQLLAFTAFVKDRRLDDELRRRDWAAFAAGYNGSGFAQNCYDERLAAAWERHNHQGV